MLCSHGNVLEYSSGKYLGFLLEKSFCSVYSSKSFWYNLSIIQESDFLRVIQVAHDSKKSALAATFLSHKCHSLASVEGEGDILETEV